MSNLKSRFFGFFFGALCVSLAATPLFGETITHDWEDFIEYTLTDTEISDDALTIAPKWEEVTPSANWSGRQGHTLTAFDDKLWVLGGTWENDVWHTTDGANWTRAVENADWHERAFHASIAFDNKLWVMGGLGDGRQNDVWSSTDGVTWVEVTTSAWDSGRNEISVVEFNDDLWVLGGFDGSYLNEVWSSTDGKNWEQKPDADWSGRSYPEALVFDDKIWVLGGIGSGSEVYNDVWYYEDGEGWNKAMSSAPWSARRQHQSFVHNEKMWVAGGFDADNALLNDVWSSTDGVNWVQVFESAEWSERRAFGAESFDGKIWVTGGNDGSNRSDVLSTDLMYNRSGTLMSDIILSPLSHLVLSTVTVTWDADIPENTSLQVEVTYDNWNTWPGTEVVEGITYNPDVSEVELGYLITLEGEDAETPALRSITIDYTLYDPLAEVWSGSGTKEDPYIITDADELQNMNEALDAHFALGNDIDALETETWNEEKGFNPIGYSDSDWVDFPFTGSLDGKGYRISGLFMDWEDEDGVFYGGLFGYTDGAEIKNLRLKNVDITFFNDQWGSVGGLIGNADNTDVSNVHVSGSVIGGDGPVGGLVGKASGGSEITGSFATGEVTGEDKVGGLCGHAFSATISDSYASGDVEGVEQVGGLVGCAFESTITNCYATGAVTGERDVGGLVGDADGNTITNSFSVGRVTGDLTTGGFVGYEEDNIGTNNFWDVETSSQTESDFGEGKTTAELQRIFTFGPWDITDVGSGETDDSEAWNIVDRHTYPFLSWQDNPIPAAYTQGTGEEGDPYFITTLYQLQAMDYERDAYYKLGNDIDASATRDWVDEEGFGGFLPVGYTIAEDGPTFPFSGSLNGNGYVITGLFMNWEDVEDIIGGGLFGSADGAEVKYVGLEEADITISHFCMDSAGGLIGSASHCNIEQCYSVAVVSGETSGGLAGSIASSTVTHSYSSGTVSGENRAGGLIGQNYQGIVRYSYSVAIVTGTNHVGGLVGKVGDDGGDYEDTANFWDTETSLQVESAMGSGKTTKQMMSSAAFSDWDLVSVEPGENDTGSIWNIVDELSYPFLSWGVNPVVVPPEVLSLELEALDTRVILTASATDHYNPLHEKAYQFRVSSSSAEFCTVEKTEWVSSPVYAWQDLSRGSTYWFSVRARNDIELISDWYEPQITVTRSERYYHEDEDEDIIITDGEQDSVVTIAIGSFSDPVRGETGDADPDRTGTADGKLPGLRHLVEPRDFVLLNAAGDVITDFSGVPAGGITIQFSYPSGLTRSDLNNLNIIRLSDDDEWVPIEDYDIDESAMKITARLSSLSVYGLAVFPYSTLSSVFVYPNPYKPGDLLHGGAEGSSGVIIGGLPESADIRIFSIAGELVEEISHRGGTSFRWEKAGDVASGVYIMVVESGGDTETVKFAVVK